MTATRGRGVLIVFEGAEGVGKSTQLRRLAVQLADADVPHQALREPGGTVVGERIRELLLDPSAAVAPETEALLFVASRAQIVADRIRPALDAGEIVLLDRFFLSTYAYQIVGRGLDADGIRAANRLATGGLVPDVTLVFDLPVEDGLARADGRGARDRMEQAGDAFHRRVGAAFGTFITPQWQAEYPEAGPIVRVDARGSEADVFGRVMALLAQRFPDVFASLPSIGRTQ